MNIKEHLKALPDRIHYGATRAITALIGIFSPHRALRYAFSREVYRALSKRGYAAGKLVGANQLWTPTNRTADQEMAQDRRLTTARARDLIRNNAYVAGAIKTIVANVVGTGIVPKPNVKKKSGSLDKTFNEAIKTAWATWVDKTGFLDIQKLILRHLISDGEVLCLPVAGKLGAGVVPLKLKLYEADHLSESTVDIGGTSSGNYVYAGVEVNADGETVAYHLADMHPSGLYFLNPGTTKRFPVGSIVHVFSRERITQSRGISWLAPIILEVYDLAEYKDYEMIGAKLAAAFSVFVKSPYQDPYDTELTRGRKAGDGKTRMEYIEPGRIERLLPGEEIQVASHDRPGSNYGPFIQVVLRGISIALGMAYESFSGDFTSSTYSSARSALLGERRQYRIIQRFLVDNFLTPVWKEFVRYAVLSGLVPSAGFLADPERYFSAIWQAPGWEWIDPENDAAAAEKELSLGLTTRRKLCAARGEDYEDNLEQLAIEEKLAADLELDVKPAKKAGGEAAFSAPDDKDSGEQSKAA